MRERLRNSVRWKVRCAILLRVSIPSRDGFALAREKADPIFDFGESFFEFLRIAAIMLRGWATPVRQSTLP
jgi:hypothetical protein